jgi:MFS family permease
VGRQRDRTGNDAGGPGDPPASPAVPGGSAESRRRPAKPNFWTDLVAVLAERNFRRLFTTRLISQAGDGIFTAGVGTYVFFNATTFPNPARGAAAFAVLYLPYSLIGPFAGVFIDRWSRRQILVFSALIRSVFVLLTAALMALGNHGVPLYVAVLLVLGVNRFFLSSLSAALPHVVAGDKLVMANSVSPTLGGLMAAVGGIAALGLNAATGDTERAAAVTVLVTGGCYVAAGLVAATMGRDLLGPVRETGGPAVRLSGELASVLAGLAAGARYVARRRGPAAALGATAGNRLMYGAMFLMSILLYRNYFYPSQVTVAESHFGVLVTVSAIGYGCAALVTPPVTRRLSRVSFIALLLAVSAVLTGALGATFSQVAYLVMAFCIGLASQGVAICATTILQQEVDDAYRGRMFAFYDVTFNVTYTLGAVIGAALMPANGHAPLLIAVLAAGYAVTAAAYWLAAGRRQPWPGADGGAVMPSARAQRSSS